MKADIALALKTVAQLFYCYPTSDLLSVITDTSLQEWPVVGDDDAEALQILIASDRDFNVICADYTRMFIGPGKKLVYPWSSIYLDDEPLMFGDSTERWEKFCHRYGIGIEQQSNDPSDHFALILWVMADLFDNPQAQSLCEQVVKEFCLPWIPSLLTSVVAASQTVFYRQLAQLAQIYLRLIAEQFVDRTYTPPRTTIADVVVKR
ncbi:MULTISPECIES: TorD/DmsD family molecular chaperone [Shewanella]|jgi:TorA maturation chaperone TorD|uniref:TorD/DmsD family molecular chaperone n=1 Tax=Shewanella TaxID=22 RepID=UPI00167B1BBA|nr:molecular chaperone TorD family protein [Shewanella fodinae]MCL2906116.1 molecular chaperone TorD family protein [Shewanella fodinae]GGY98567.1 hypothetical protein GCM10007169_14330 [Shewanella fodinae]